MKTRKTSLLRASWRRKVCRRRGFRSETRRFGLELCNSLKLASPTITSSPRSQSSTCAVCKTLSKKMKTCLLFSSNWWACRVNWLWEVEVPIKTKCRLRSTKSLSSTQAWSQASRKSRLCFLLSTLQAVPTQLILTPTHSKHRRGQLTVLWIHSLMPSREATKIPCFRCTAFLIFRADRKWSTRGQSSALATVWTR